MDEQKRLREKTEQENKRLREQVKARGSAAKDGTIALDADDDGDLDDLDEEAGESSAASLQAKLLAAQRDHDGFANYEKEFPSPEAKETLESKQQIVDGLGNQALLLL